MRKNRPRHAAALAWLLAVSPVAMVLSLTACDVVKPDRDRQEELTFYDFSSAMRWNDFDAAYGFVDPQTKIDHPMSETEHERWKQFEVSGYEVMNKSEHDDSLDQEVKLDIINRNTQIPRSVIYKEHWHWDAEKKKWWLTSGMPDLSPQD